MRRVVSHKFFQVKAAKITIRVQGHRSWRRNGGSAPAIFEHGFRPKQQKPSSPTIRSEASAHLQVGACGPDFMLKSRNPLVTKRENKPFVATRWPKPAAFLPRWDGRGEKQSSNKKQGLQHRQAGEHQPQRLCQSKREEGHLSRHPTLLFHIHHRQVELLLAAARPHRQRGILAQQTSSLRKQR